MVKFWCLKVEKCAKKSKRTTVEYRQLKFRIFAHQSARMVSATIALATSNTTEAILHANCSISRRLICHCDPPPVPSNRSNDILGLSNTLNFLLSFLLSYNLSLWCCSQNHIEFSELKRRDKIQSQRLICHHYLQKTTGNDELDLFNTLNSLVSSILPYNPSLQSCSQNRTQFSGFRIPR